MVNGNRRRKVIRVCVQCRRNAEHQAFGLCRRCYGRQWWLKKYGPRRELRKQMLDQIRNARQCYGCDSRQTTLKDGKYPRWIVNPPIGVLCVSCYHMIFKNSHSKDYWKNNWRKVNARRSTPIEEIAYLRNLKRRGKIFKILNQYVCEHCGFDDWRALELDHKNGGGCYSRKKLGGQSAMYSYYIRNPDIARKELQILCSNCNKIKRFENLENRKYIPVLEPEEVVCELS